MNEERCLCKNFDEWTGECCSATPMCSEPFSKEACVDFKKWVYNRQKGLKKPDFDDFSKGVNYKPSEQIGFTKKTWGDVVKHLGIQKGDVILKKFLPDSERDALNASIHDIHEYYVSEVSKQLIKETGVPFMKMYVINGYVLGPDDTNTGTLFLAVGHN